MIFKACKEFRMLQKPLSNRAKHLNGPNIVQVYWLLCIVVECEVIQKQKKKKKYSNCKCNIVSTSQNIQAYPVIFPKRLKF